jgi:hypothetical protein
MKRGKRGTEAWERKGLSNQYSKFDLGMRCSGERGGPEEGLE